MKALRRLSQALRPSINKILILSLWLEEDRETEFGGKISKAPVLKYANWRMEFVWDAAELKMRSENG